MLGHRTDQTDLPPGLLPLRVLVDVKPETGFHFWSLGDAIGWSVDPAREEMPADALGPMPQHTRVQVKIDSGRSTADPGFLYSLRLLVFPDGTPNAQWPRRSTEPPEPTAAAILCQVGLEGEWLPQPAVVTLGGERRVAYLDLAEQHELAWPAPANALPKVLSNGAKLRLQLVTPAILDGGWKPGWLNDELIGCPPTAAECELRLVAAAVGRRQAVSGWDYERNEPRPPRYMVPAGSVFFFEVHKGRLDPGELWLASICDQPSDRQDGFGLVLPGVWTEPA